MDLTSKLPDEILMQVFDGLSSLRYKLRLESISRRFQRCVLELLNTKPVPLEIDVTGGKLDECAVPREQLSGVVLTLANKVKFNSIGYYADTGLELELNLILSALVSSANHCLDKVTTFAIVSKSPVSLTLLTETFSKCTELTDVRVLVGNEDMWNLGLALNDKPLTQLSVALRNQDQQQLIQLCQSIKPNTLKKTKLNLSHMTLNVDLLVTELCGGAWAALEEMELECTAVHMQMDRLFNTVPQFPSLRKCKFVLHETQTSQQLLATLGLLFINQIDTTVSFDMVIPGCSDITGCRIVWVIRQLRAVHPNLQVDFVGCRNPRLTLGQVTFQQELGNWHANCLDCGILYPTVITMLTRRASDRVRGWQQAVHLANARLDRCRIDTVVAHLNCMGAEMWKALHAEMNEEDQNLATITFESQSMFQITVECGPCLSNGCSRCIVG